ncbi:MAG: hypothetical protein E5V37_04770 [Mesorhizobium sp.]|uniref:hypothetical protein n=1 Tax=unclassified Mesorhizobium TaxID=325217 RepID=UPI000FCA3E67|nr:MULTISPECIES: hypothetical protein [unclassified Mesorhizobium]RUW40412.1 hypothetical protein EOA37_15025 [Mesorhizobium sp. M2A.F.Ca.ET.015.02.1.1]RVC97945.1 hypothetical protein EN739_02530 [Mesorhizobium sp. M2A.F.Ca.ET.017.03.2.1]RVD08013.1 hypothetical protein EN753_15795 [Mesorhizobium sp. M2A.F.Ca.ET.029.05.1.1]RWB40636.1 MAG: hypothetical protein EOQ46_24305 [Mesorhizobium sp.]RWB62703.1 MAG: hypothetical protein EOQ48_11290 [Mesorhizobium sp.]
MAPNTSSKLSDLMQPDRAVCALPQPSTRKQVLYAADAFLKANPEPKKPAVRIRYRGGRPALNWLAKQDPVGAAALWLIARQRLPVPANDNDAVAEGLALDRSRKDGKPRGKNADPRSLDAYLALPSIQPRLGDPEPQPARLGRWDGESRGITIKPQRQPGDYKLYPFGRYTKCQPAIAEGTSFIGAAGGLGQPKVGKHRGDVRRAEEPVILTPPAAVDNVIEVILAGGNVAAVGQAFGARGGGADRRGGKELCEAARWARAVVANDNWLTSAATG